ncbi:hypothetical protein TrCOL_g11742 [Triparma columacea]|uniref:Uncharacterized protein n=1 Tax=Triparma columacea TaxID=722753 RepID=A0A9W7G8D9_9STRA|nr:hypothetical protein TrCOL_g11742 [Triparma columacea]
MDIDVDGEASADESEGEDVGGREKKRRRGMPRREDFPSVIEYLEAKYTAGVTYDSDASSGGSERGSVYGEEDSLVDDEELRAQLEDDVIGGVEVEEGEGEGGFFVTSDNVNLRGEEFIDMGDPEAQDADGADMRQKRKEPAKTDDEYLADYTTTKDNLENAKNTIRTYAMTFERERRDKDCKETKLKVKAPSKISEDRILKIKTKDIPCTPVDIPPNIQPGEYFTVKLRVPVEGYIKEGEKIVIPNTDEAGEAIQNVLDAYNKFVSAESLYNLKVLKKQGAQDYVTYDLKAMKAKKFDWFKDWAHGTEKEWDGVRKRWRNRMRQREKRVNEKKAESEIEREPAWRGGSME